VGGRSGAAGGHEPTSGRYEWDPAKSASNKEKHGVDFTEAQAIWQDEHRITAQSQFTTESRQQTIGLIDSKLWAAVTTMRGDVIRIISVRRARKDEEERYGQQQADD
jgi:uncharacterized DUF497 family protein